MSYTEWSYDSLSAKYYIAYLSKGLFLNNMSNNAYALGGPELQNVIAFFL
jgi:hypothetical protein